MSELTQIRPVGGIASVEISPAHNVSQVEIHSTNSRRRELILRDNSLLKELPLIERGSTYAAEADARNGIISVCHKLTLVVEHSELENIVSLAANGIIAIATTRAGERLLIGWSDKFGIKQPLRLCSVEFSTGTKPLNRPLATIVFECLDTSLNPIEL